jgi:hypothetical protein
VRRDEVEELAPRHRRDPQRERGDRHRRTIGVAGDGARQRPGRHLDVIGGARG